MTESLINLIRSMFLFYANDISEKEVERFERHIETLKKRFISNAKKAKELSELKSGLKKILKEPIAPNTYKSIKELLGKEK